MPALDVVRLREEFPAPHELVKTSDGKVLFLRHWVGAPGTDLAVLLLHGITAYSEPYGKLGAEDLARIGVNVFGLDLRGHGRSDGRRGDLPSGERLSRDLGETIDFLKTRYSRVVLLGHSLGAISALIAVHRFPRRVDGLILLSAARRVTPGIYRKPSAGAAVKILFGIALFRSRPWIEYNRRGMLGRDDPLFNFHYTARFYSAVYGVSPWTVVRMLRRNLLESPYLSPSSPLEVPVLVGVGDQDELFSVDSSQEFFAGLPASHKTFLVIPGGRHASFPPNSWRPIAEWLSHQFPAGSGGVPPAQ
jgi:acylglycerol lipase